MTKEAYELLKSIMQRRAETYEIVKDFDRAWTYRHLLSIIEMAQDDNIECLRQFDY